MTEECDSRVTRSLYGHYFACLGAGPLGRALSATKARKLEPGKGRLRKPGGYFNNTCQAIAKELGIDLRRDAA